jgi:hypothetical protein
LVEISEVIVGREGRQNRPEVRGFLEYLLRLAGRLTSGDLRRTTTLPAVETVAARTD